ncbi:MAG TPA: 5-formyltetrahydrofolate cyclo-ligase [Methylomirabilota bacterium]|nr:5-formyltetrahydrofolate cyclo-ligase [Methylomirabilota bacterium]
MLDPFDIAEAKANLRVMSLARRDAIPAGDRTEGSRKISSVVTPMIPAGAAVSAFLPIRSEVDLRPAVEVLSAIGHTVGLPVIDGRRLLFRAFSPAAPLVPHGFGTLGPGEDAPLVDPDVMLVPFAVFDRTLNRIGYGKAYYDITIAEIRASGRDPLLIGVGFSVQEADHIPLEPHDVPLHRIVTEREIVLPPST